MQVSFSSIQIIRYVMQDDAIWTYIILYMVLKKETRINGTIVDKRWGGHTKGNCAILLSWLRTLVSVLAFDV